mgnify:CR=1 FL=1
MPSSLIVVSERRCSSPGRWGRRSYAPDPKEGYFPDLRWNGPRSNRTWTAARPGPADWPDFVPAERLWFCLWLPQLPLEAMGAGVAPAAVVDEQHGVHRILLANRAAHAAGVIPGQAANAALALLPALQLEERSALREQQALEGLGSPEFREGTRGAGFDLGRRGRGNGARGSADLQIADEEREPGLGDLGGRAGERAGQGGDARERTREALWWMLSAA